MSSMDQAFVKAFSRRNRTSAPSHQPLAPQPQVDASLTVRETPTAPAAVDPQSKSPATTPEPGTLELDRSVSRTAKVWVDPIEDQIARADKAESTVPTPHVDSHTNVIDSLQHIHTAYATAFTDIALGQTGSAGAIDLEVTPTSPQNGDQLIEEVVAEPDPVEQRPSTVDPVGPSGPSVELPTAGDGTQLRFDTPLERPQAPAAEEEIPEHEETTEEEEKPATAIESKKAVVPFRAAWEVDVFDIPTSVADLFFEGSLFQEIADQMTEAVATGLSSILITSTKQAEGRTSVAIGMAMASAAAGLRVALVDADSETPTLADELRLDLQLGWVDSVRGRLPIKEVAVHAAEDGVTLIPLMPPKARAAATAFEFVQLIELIRDKFDLIIVDGPTAMSPSLHQCAAAVDSALIVRDVTRTDKLAINEFNYRLRQSGVQGVGVIENRVNRG